MPAGVAASSIFFIVKHRQDIEQGQAIELLPTRSDGMDCKGTGFRRKNGHSLITKDHYQMISSRT